MNSAWSRWRTGKVDFLLPVWGDWHLDALERAALPTLLCDANLPTALRRCSGRLVVLTRRSDVARIRRMPGFRRLGDLLECSVQVASEADEPHVSEHVRWSHVAAAAARERGAWVVLLHPDVVWAAGAIPHVLDALASGKKAVLMPPNLRAVSETLLPELERRTGEHDGALSLTPAEVVRLGTCHLHPLSAMALAGARQWLPASDRLWTVPGEGFVVCKAASELLAYDPAAHGVTEKRFASQPTRLEDVHTIRDSDDIFMLSLAPLAKDFGLAVFDHDASPFELARWSMPNPYNESPLNRHLPLLTARLHHAPMTERLWRRTERRARATMQRMLRLREVVKVFLGLRDEGCQRASQLLALAVDALDMPRVLRGAGPSTFFVPSDAAFAQLPKRELHELLSVGSESRLRAFLLAHVVPGRHALDGANARLRTRAGRELAVSADASGRRLIGGSIPIVKTAEASGHLLHVIDGALWDF